jgi:hypothetical protein
MGLPTRHKARGARMHKHSAGRFEQAGRLTGWPGMHAVKAHMVMRTHAYMPSTGMTRRHLAHLRQRGH